MLRDCRTGAGKVLFKERVSCWSDEDSKIRSLFVCGSSALSPMASENQNQ